MTTHIDAATRARAEFRSLCEWDWVVLPNGTHLHGVRELNWDGEYVDIHVPGITACGRSGLLSIPGLFTRMGAQRCALCCRALGYPMGTGSPKNDEACRELATRRAATHGRNP